MNEIDTMALAPLSAGDLLDRIVRLYRQHWVALMRVAILPTLLTYAATMALSFGFRNFTTEKGDLRLALGVMLVLSGFAVWVFSKGVLLILLGGVANELVQYFMDGSPVQVRNVYRVVKTNFWRLVGAAILALIMMLMLAFVLYFLVGIGGGLYILSAVWLLTSFPTWLQVTLHIIVGTAAFIVINILFAMTLKRAAFLPQIITVEHKNVSGAMSRCFSLAGSEFKLKDALPAGALVFFYVYIMWSVALLFLLPIYGFAMLYNIDAGPFSAQQPVWYAILTNTVSQASEILITPVMMLGFILLYIDSRVRREGFDLELLANRYLPAAGVVIPHGDFPLEIPKPKNNVNDDTPPDANQPFDTDSNLTVLSLR